jgi:hypothetical protein
MQARESQTKKSHQPIDSLGSFRGFPLCGSQAPEFVLQESFLSNASRRDARERTLHDTDIFFDRDNLVAL